MKADPCKEKPAAAKSLSGEGEEKILQREVDRTLLRSLEPAALVVDSDLEVIQFRGRTRPFLEHS
ncbi:MAG: hypothetical protein R6V08_01360, partial [Desulfuromonadales bacterium]